MTELEDRGLVGWDRAANRYDLHPIVRGVVWNSLSQERRREVCETLQAHFQPIEVPKYLDVTSLEDLTPAIELFHALIELDRFDDAFIVLRDRLDRATHFQLSASRLRTELVERLFPGGTKQLPRLSRLSDQGDALNSLALAYQYSGQPSAAVPLFGLARDLDQQANDQHKLSIGLGNLSAAERLSGALRAAEVSARTALQIAREIGEEFNEAVSLLMLGLALAVRSSSVAEPGVWYDALTALEDSQQLFTQQHNQACIGVVTAYRAVVALWCDESAAARTLADRAWELSAVNKGKADFIRAARLQGTAALRRSGGSPESEQAIYEVAHERLHHALARARACDRVEEELPTLIALAELHEALARSPVATLARAWGKGTHAVASPTHALASVATSHDGTLGSPLGRREPESLTTSLQLTPAEHLDQAERLLDDVWVRAERGPYPLFQADAFNRLASLERTRAALLPADSLERIAALDRAGKAALRAYEKAWLDGPPFAYAYGLSHAAEHLAELGITPPDLPPYDESKFPPMPDEPVVRKKSNP